MKSIGKTDKGKVRTLNEDSFFCSDSKVGKLPNLYIIADGMGGHNAGEYASSCAVEEFVNYVKNSNSDNINEIFIDGIQYINQCIYKKSLEDKNYYGMGTTFVVCSIIGNILYVANVGDSRLYSINNEIRQITRDHSLVEEMIENGQLNRSDEKSHPDKNIITRAVGVSDTVEVDVFKLDILGGNMIFMCSDGLTNMVDEDKILDVIKNNQEIKEIINELITIALDNGGIDNITTILIR